MFYIANFNYNDTEDTVDNYCLMPAIVEANSTDEALDKFQAMFLRIAETSNLLNGAEKIYLDSLIEFETFPQEGTVVQWQKIVPSLDGLCSITSPLPEAEELENATAFSWSGTENATCECCGDESCACEDDERDCCKDTACECCDHDEDPEEMEEEPFLIL